MRDAPTTAEILGELAVIAGDELGWRGKLRPEMDLVQDLELDSIRLLTLTVAVENRFRIRLDEEDEAAITTVGELVEAIRSKGRGGDAG